MTAPAAVLAGLDRGGLLPWVTVAHLAAMGGAALLARKRSTGGRWAGWGPLIAMTVLYGELPSLMAGAAWSAGSQAVNYHDAVVQHWESRLFGGSPAIFLAGQLPSSLSNLLHAAYLSYYAIIFLPPLILFFQAERAAEFASTILALTSAFAVCFVVFAYWPVEGPRYAWPPPPGMPHGLVRDLALRLLKAGSSRGAAFPSSHVAVATTQALVALAYQRRVGIATTIVAVLLAVGAVYGGFHYGVDVLVGATLGLLVTQSVLVYSRGPRTLLSISEDVTPALAQGQAD